jgi:hypothetical protein
VFVYVTMFVNDNGYWDDRGRRGESQELPGGPSSQKPEDRSQEAEVWEVLEVWEAWKSRKSGWPDARHLVIFFVCGVLWL